MDLVKQSTIGCFLWSVASQLTNQGLVANEKNTTNVSHFCQQSQLFLAETYRMMMMIAIV